jgi:hypothetical protein
MTGRAEVDRLRQVLDATFDRASRLLPEPELQSDFARYLCVLVSGFLEQAVQEFILEHTRRNASTRVLRYVESQLRRLTNIKAQRLVELFGTLDETWGTELESFVIDERKAAVDSVVELRNRISHGHHVDLTMNRVIGYYKGVKEVVDRIGAICG